MIISKGNIVLEGFILFLLLIVSNIVVGQNYQETIDSLEKKIHTHTAKGEVLVDLLNDLSYAYRRSRSTKIDSFATEALRLAQEIEYQRGIAIAYKNMAIANARKRGNRDTSILYLQRCYDLAVEAKDYATQAACLNNLAHGLRGQFRYVASVQKFRQALEIHTKHLPLDRLRILIIGNLGKTYANAGDYENARLYLKDCLTLSEEQNQPALTVMYMEDLAMIQYELGDTTEAIQLLEEYIPIAKSIGDHSTFIQSSYSLTSILIENQQYEKAKKYTQKALAATEEYQIYAEKCELLINYSKILLAENRKEAALKMAKEAHACAEGYEMRMRSASENLLVIKLATKDFTGIEELFSAYNILTEQHFDLEQQKTNASLEAQYQNTQKEAENNRLRIQQLENKSTIRVQRLLGLFVFLLSLLLTGGVWYAYQLKKRQNSLLEEKVAKRTKALSKSNQELALSNQELAQSNEELERFVYIASHDLKQPVITIISFSSLLEKRLQTQTDFKSLSLLQYIKKEGIQMKILIEDILEYSLLKEETKAHQQVDLNILIQDITHSITEMISLKNAQIRILKTLPSIVQDKTNLYLLFKNLIENGLKYNQSTTPIIDISFTSQNDSLTLSVKDNGIGIEEEFIPKIFNMFNRLHTKKEYEGSGLGLSICEKIVSKMGGSITVESQPDYGSIFYVKLPLHHFDQDTIASNKLPPSILTPPLVSKI